MVLRRETRKNREKETKRRARQTEMMRQVTHRNHQLPHVSAPPIQDSTEGAKPLPLSSFILSETEASAVSYEAMSPVKRSGFNPAVGWIPVIVFCLYIPTGLYLDQEGTAWCL